MDIRRSIPVPEDQIAEANARYQQLEQATQKALDLTRAIDNMKRDMECLEQGYACPIHQEPKYGRLAHELHDREDPESGHPQFRANTTEYITEAKTLLSAASTYHDEMSSKKSEYFSKMANHTVSTALRDSLKAERKKIYASAPALMQRRNIHEEAFQELKKKWDDFYEKTGCWHEKATDRLASAKFARLEADEDERIFGTLNGEDKSLWTVADT